MPTNPLPQRDMRVAEFMADKPNGDRYEVRLNAPDSSFTYTVYFIPTTPQALGVAPLHNHERPEGKRVGYTYTLWGARREIRKHRKRMRKMIAEGVSADTLVYWERF